MSGEEEISLSVEETNRLRASLGLAPLKVNEEADKEKKRKQEEAMKEQKSTQLASMLSHMKRKRDLQRKIQGRGLGDPDEEDDSAAAWVAKARGIQHTNLQKEKELAAKRAAQLDLLDDDTASGSISLAHNVDSLNALEDGMVLTLKDTSILNEKGEDLNEDEDELENVRLADVERLQKHKQMKQKKVKYNPYDDSVKTILHQYDEEDPNATKGIVITTSGQIVNEKEAQQVNTSLKEGTALASLDLEKKFANEYLSKEESQIAFKKSSGTKKKKLRKKVLDELSELASEAANKEAEQDRGSRSRSVKLQKQSEEEYSKELKAQSYQKAIDKAHQSVATLFEKEQETAAESRIKDEEEDKELLKSVQRAREVALSKRKATEEEVLNNLRKLRSQKTEEASNAPSESLVFTSTSEFVRGLNVEDTEEPSKPSTESKTGAQIHMEIENDREEHEKMLQQVKPKAVEKMEVDAPVKQAVEENEIKEDEEDEDSGIFEELPNAGIGGGIAATLAMLKGRQNDDDMIWSGRRTDERLTFKDTEDPAPHISLERLDPQGRPMTQKEAFRHLSHVFHGRRPGKTKVEKRMKQEEEDRKKRAMDVKEGTVNALGTLQAEQERRQTPYIVLSATKTISDLTTAKKNNSAAALSKGSVIANQTTPAKR